MLPKVVKGFSVLRLLCSIVPLYQSLVPVELSVAFLYHVKKGSLIPCLHCNLDQEFVDLIFER